ncbi:N-acetylmuramoyl-L-alanine amidase [Aquamicrobium soli]|jgi:N-acetylmuramoyl-L-alanine amidase|uniref:N-acetylmuramoyl-L-alanine amidase n=1 Tax=Aquamicrobium soli TaxID=1811518 RepID=A0ABV7KCA5_9HYPH
MEFTAILRKGVSAAGRNGRVALLLLMGAIFLALAPLCQAADAPLRALSYTMTGDATHMQVAVEFDREPDVRWFLLRAPDRMVIDLPATRFSLDPKAVKAKGLVRQVRYGAVDETAARLILVGKGPFVVDRFDVLENEDGKGYRFVADLSSATEKEFEEALAVQAQTTGSTVSVDKGDRVGAPPAATPAHRFTIVLDPGHGGIDGGAESAGGTIEKNVTLAFAKELRDKLAATGKYDLFLTRDGDDFLRLDDRVRIARQHGADLFISIHADTINLKGIRGATVYTVSDKASDAEAQALADRENLSDQLAGIEIKNDSPEVTDILVDLIRRETHSFSMRFASTLVGKLSDSVGLINNPHRYAGFRVLKAPDVPSVLIELGYLSNPKDEAQLLDPDWRGKAAQSIADAVALFAAARVGG